jgi:TRAP transporter 4TM/12TM fusion protein
LPPAADLASAAIIIVGIGWIGDIPRILGVPVETERFIAILLGLALAQAFLDMAATTTGWRARAGACAAAAAFGVCLWCAVFFYRLNADLPYLTAEVLIVSVLLLTGVAVAVWRQDGPTLVLFAAVVAAYAGFGGFLPATIAPAPLSLARMTAYAALDTNGLLGLPLRIAAEVVLAFVLFGQALTWGGGGRVLSGIATLAMGRFRGGAAKVAVVGSALFGMISGSAVSNASTIGAMTIPTMRRAGLPAEVAAAIEATASTGGQIMPPVMGATAFLMAEFLGVGYSDVVIAAIGPALLFYLAVFMQVDLAAVRYGIKALSREDIAAQRPPMRSWLLLLPAGVLCLGLLALSWRVETAAIVATVAGLLVSPLANGPWPRPAEIWRLLVAAGRSMGPLLVLSAIAGVVVGLINLSGLGLTFTFLLVDLGSSSLLLLLLATAAVAIVLGLGMPTTAVYVLLAVSFAPPLIKAGVPAMAAHMFVFYYGMLSMITPPVAFTAMAAATIAGANTSRVGWLAMRMSWAAFVLPLLFATVPALLTPERPLAFVLAFAPSVLGVVLVTRAIGLVSLSPARRLVEAAIGAACLAGIVMLA